MLIGAEFVGRAINMVVSILMRRWLLPERMGVMGTITSYGVIPAIVAEAGMTRATIQQIARSEPEALPLLIGHMAATRLATNFIYLLLTWTSLLLPFNDKLASQEKWFIVIWSCSMVFQSFRRNAEAAFLATEKLRYQSLLVIVNRLVSGALVLGVIHWNRQSLHIPQGAPGWYSIMGFVFGAYLVADLFDWLLSWIVLRKSITNPVFNFDWRPKLQLLIVGWPFALQMLAGQIYFFIDVPLIRYLYKRPEAEVLREIGDYGTAYNMILVLISIPINLSYTLFPQMSRAFHTGDQSRLYSLFGYSLQLMILAGTPIALAFFLFRSEFITIVYGPSYLHAIPMMAVLAWTLPLAFVNATISNLMAASDKQNFVNIAMITAAAFNVIVNVMVIPVHGAVGSSFVTLATEAVMLLVQVICVLAFHRAAFHMRKISPMLMFQLASFFLFLYVQHLPITVRVIAYLVYAVACVLWGRKMVLARRFQTA